MKIYHYLMAAAVCAAMVMSCKKDGPAEDPKDDGGTETPVPPVTGEPEDMTPGLQATAFPSSKAPRTTSSNSHQTTSSTVRLSHPEHTMSSILTMKAPSLKTMPSL